MSPALCNVVHYVKVGQCRLLACWGLHQDCSYATIVSNKLSLNPLVCSLEEAHLRKYVDS